MNNNKNMQHIEPLSAYIHKLIADLNNLSTGINPATYSNSQSALTKLVSKSHELAIECRKLYTSSSANRSNLECIKSLYGIGYKYKHNPTGFTFEMPTLLPGRSDKTFIIEPLDEFLRLYTRDMPTFRQCTIIFRHVYKEETFIRDVRDHDNIEYRSVMNVIERYLLTSDSAYYCTNVQISETGTEDKTIITILPGKLSYGKIMEGVINEIV